MQVIIEGPDGSGKSTLIRSLVKLTGWKIISGEGPEKAEGEMAERIKRIHKQQLFAESYSCFPQAYDRHPCVSQSVYGPLRDGYVPNGNELDRFYSLDSVFVYCVSPDGPPEGQNKAHDVGAHLDMIRDFHGEIRQQYDLWALTRAHVIHRFWETNSVNRTIRSIMAQTGDMT